MSKTKWRILTVNLTDDQYRRLKAVAGLKAMSASALIKELLERHLEAFTGILPYVEGLERPKVEQSKQREET